MVGGCDLDCNLYIIVFKCMNIIKSTSYNCAKTLTRLQSFSLPISTSSFTLSILSSCRLSSIFWISVLSVCKFSWSFYCGKRSKRTIPYSLLGHRKTAHSSAAVIQHLSRELQALPLLRPASSSFSQGQAGICQLKGQLCRLQTGLVQLGLRVIPLSDHGAQITLQALRSTLAGVQTLPKAAHFLQRGLVLCLIKHTLIHVVDRCLKKADSGIRCGGLRRLDLFPVGSSEFLCQGGDGALELQNARVSLGQ